MRIEGDGTGNGDTLLHTARDLTGEFLVGSLQVDTVEALLCPMDSFTEIHRGEHIEGEHHVLKDRHRVEECGALEDHAHLTAHEHLLVFRHLHEVTSIVKHLSTGRFEQSHEVLHQHGLSRSALSDDEVGLSILENSVDVLQNFATFKTLTQILDFYHDSNWVRKTSLKRISALDDTTASVLALPTFTEPPSTL